MNLEKEMPAVVQTVSSAMKEKETVMVIHSVKETWFVAQIIVDRGIQMLELTLIVVKWQLVITLFNHYFNCKMSERQTKAGNQENFQNFYSLIHSLSRHAEQLLFSCLCSKVTVYSRKLQCFLGPPL